MEEPRVTSIATSQERLPPHGSIYHPPKRDVGETEFENILAYVAELYCRGIQLREIAQQCNIKLTSLHDVYLPALRLRWKQSSEADYAERVAEDLAKLDALEAEYWRGWQRSLQKKATQKRMGRIHGTEQRATEFEATQEELTGDPRFLDGVHKCLERRAKLLGYEQEQKRLSVLPTGEQAGELPERFEQYEAVFGFKLVRHSAATSESVDSDSSGESLDSERSASAAERILDVTDGVR
jgi:hypothetical protein